jgi:hypothetical protein
VYQKGDVMAVTALKKVENKNNSNASIRNLETPSDTAGGKGDVKAGSAKDIDIWIPW